MDMSICLSPEGLILSLESDLPMALSSCFLLMNEAWKNSFCKSI